MNRLSARKLAILGASGAMIVVGATGAMIAAGSGSDAAPASAPDRAGVPVTLVGSDAKAFQITLDTPDGNLTVPDLRSQIPVAGMRYLGAVDGQAFIEGPGASAGTRCFLLVASATEAQVGCDSSKVYGTKPIVFWADPPGGTPVGALRLPDGYSSASLGGQGRSVVGGVLPLEGPDLKGATVTLSGAGLPDINYEIK